MTEDKSCGNCKNIINNKITDDCEECKRMNEPVRWKPNDKTQKHKGIHENLAQQIGEKVDEKSVAYNAGGKDAVAKMEDILKIHYPNGVNPEQYRDLCLIVRIEDKICRIASGNKNAFNESPYEDIVGYGLRGIMLDRDIIK